MPRRSLRHKIHGFPRYASHCMYSLENTVTYLLFGIMNFLSININNNMIINYNNFIAAVISSWQQATIESNYSKDSWLLWVWIWLVHTGNGIRSVVRIRSVRNLPFRVNRDRIAIISSTESESQGSEVNVSFFFQFRFWFHHLRSSVNWLIRSVSRRINQLHSSFPFRTETMMAFGHFE